jgi:hypothetical protein
VKDALGWAALAVAAAALIAWYLSYTAARLDRIHARVVGAQSALDAQLVRRAEATLELANAGLLDPASSLLLAGAASESLEASDEHHAGREAVESNLTDVLHLALDQEALAHLRGGDDDEEGLGSAALRRVLEANHRVQLARRFHNDAVTDVRRVRRKRVVRWFRLAGHAEMPRTFEIDDELTVMERSA